jgi:hypothetical protein
LVVRMACGHGERLAEQRERGKHDWGRRGTCSRPKSALEGQRIQTRIGPWTPERRDPQEGSSTESYFGGEAPS